MSRDKPFCDGTHTTNGLLGTRAAAGRAPPAARDAAENVTITPTPERPARMHRPADVQGADGRTAAERETWLCRCGHLAHEALLRRLARARRLQGQRDAGIARHRGVSRRARVARRRARPSRTCASTTRSCCAPPCRRSREAEGKRVRDVRRLGKRIVLALEAELFLVFHLMIAGRLRWLEPGRASRRSASRLRGFEFARRHARVHRGRHEAARVAASRPRRSGARGDRSRRPRGADCGSRRVRRAPHAARTTRSSAR